MANYGEMEPAYVRNLIRQGRITYPTAGMCGGYAQANLVVLPAEYAEDFRRFAELNPKPCPILEITKAGDPFTRRVAKEASIVTDIPKYFIYKNGVKTDECTDASQYWRDDFVGFLIGCSFSFEDSLQKGGIEVRHITMGRNVPIYRTNLPCQPSGPFTGPLIVSMRLIKAELKDLAYEITAKFPNVHGAPIHVGDPSAIGIKDINRPDYGEPVDINEGELPVFWACGVTTQAAVENARPEIVITHAPGHMFITDILNDELEDTLFGK